MSRHDRQYSLMILGESDVDPDPFGQFAAWYEDARKAKIDIANAFTLSTVSDENSPSSRMVLLKNFDKNGFVFYTNSLSRKGRELSANPRASMCFFWNRLERQLRVEGAVEFVDDAEADTYFTTRTRESRIGAWASPQGRVVRDRRELDKKFAEIEAKFENKPVPRPDFWKGYRLIPSVFEFWQGRLNRMHDRIRYRSSDSGWIVERLAP